MELELSTFLRATDAKNGAKNLICRTVNMLIVSDEQSRERVSQSWDHWVLMAVEMVLQFQQAFRAAMQGCMSLAEIRRT